jgi:uncharacterized protein DUF6544
MTTTPSSDIWSELHGNVRPMRVFHPDQVSGLPAAAAAFLRHAIAPGARLDRSARIVMHGSIKVGRWLPFRAEEFIDARDGFRWTASVAHGLVSARDSYTDRAGTTRVRALGFLPMMSASGPDVSKSALGRMLAEQAVWMPGNLLPDTGAHWYPSDAEHATVSVTKDDERSQLSLHLAPNGQLLEMTMARWGRQGRGQFHYLPFGIQIDDEATFGDFTVPSAGRVGWWYGTPRWTAGEFFRFTIDDLTTF